MQKAVMEGMFRNAKDFFSTVWGMRPSQFEDALNEALNDLDRFEGYYNMHTSFGKKPSNLDVSDEGVEVFTRTANTITTRTKRDGSEGNSVAGDLYDNDKLLNEEGVGEDDDDDDSSLQHRRRFAPKYRLASSPTIRRTATPASRSPDMSEDDHSSDYNFEGRIHIHLDHNFFFFYFILLFYSFLYFYFFTFYFYCTHPSLDISSLEAWEWAA